MTSIFYFEYLKYFWILRALCVFIREKILRNCNLATHSLIITLFYSSKIFFPSINSMVRLPSSNTVQGIVVSLLRRFRNFIRNPTRAYNNRPYEKRRLKEHKRIETTRKACNWTRLTWLTCKLIYKYKSLV